MTFLNPAVLIGLAAVAVPIALHLIARRQPRRVVIGSIGFLSKRYESNRSRLRIRRYWLLAMRIAALAAMAVALAMPAVASSFSGTWWLIGAIGVVAVVLLATATMMGARGHDRRAVLPIAGAGLIAMIASVGYAGFAAASGPSVSLGISGPAAVAIVVDNGVSSAYRDSSGNHLDRMRSMVGDIVGELPRTSRVAIIDRSSVPPSFAIDTAGAKQRADSIELRERPAPLGDRIEAARRIVASSDLEAKHVIVLSNLSARTWQPLVESLTSRGGGGSGVATPPSGVDPSANATIHLVDVGPTDELNAALSSVDLVDRFPPAGVSVPVAAKVSLAGSTEGTATEPVSVTAELRWYDSDPALPVIRDGQLVTPDLVAVDRSTLNLMPGGDAEVVLSIPSLPVGIHHGQLRLSGNDAMPLDDVRYLTLQVPPRSDVLIVGDDADEAFVIEQTIQATALPGDQAAGKYNVVTIGFDDLPVARLSDFRAIILLDPSPGSVGGEAIDNYLASGGSVAWMLGPAMTPDFRARSLPPLKRVWRTGDPPTFFDPIAIGDPMIAPVGRDVPWNQYRIDQYWQTELEPANSELVVSRSNTTDQTALANGAMESNDATDWRVLIRYAGTGHAALLWRQFDGGGSSLVFTTPMPALTSQTRAWNELFGGDPWPAWLLVRHAIDELVRGDRPFLNLAVGQSLSIRPGDSEPADGREPAARWQWYQPGESVAVPIEVKSRTKPVVLASHDRSGTYWIRGGGPSGYSVNLSPEATSLERVSFDSIPDFPMFLMTDRLESVDQLELTSDAGRGRVPLQSPLLMLALSAFLVEQYLGNRFYGRRAPAAV